MVRSRALLLVLLLTSASAWGQKDRYMVFFKDKDGTPFSVSEPGNFLSQAAISRRVKHDIEISVQDLPVNPAYVGEVRSLGADVFFTTRWLNGLLIQAEDGVIRDVESLPFVDRVELVAPQARLTTRGRSRVVERKKGAKVALTTDVQLSMIGLNEMHEDNIRGDGITIAILDAGFEGVDVASPFRHIFDEERINLDASYDFVYNSDNVFQYDDHGTEVFSVIAALQPGEFTGGAYKATYQLYVTEEVPTEYRVEEYNWLFAAERADSAGADIIQSSLGYYDFDGSSMDYLKSEMDGSTTVVTRAAQWAAERGIIVVVSAGNEGNVSWQIVTAPADADDVLAVASVDANLKRANSSSTGPTSDQRLKPDVAALGVGTSVIESSGSPGKSSGTSLAAPLITSLAAGILQKYPSSTNLEILDAIRKSASQSANPDFLIGYGVPHFRAVVNFMEAVVQENDFEVFPNPFAEETDSLIIRPKNPGQITDCSIELVSGDGRSVLRATPAFSWLNNQYSPEVSHLLPGIYFLRISANGRKYTYKLIRK
jgi:subtilisin family serine protease